MSLGPGTRLGPYEIVSPIGSGGMGEVYRATDTSLGRDVAIKVLPDAYAQDPERVARFEREAKTLASLNHPNIAIIHGLEKSQGTYALVMELVEGEDLSQRISRGPIPIDEALPITRQIAEALEAAHEQGIIHRDLKPANIKVRPDGTVKVLDFGLAKLAETSGAGPPSPSPLSMSPTITSPALMTGVGVLLGTAAYMSPEQAKGKPADKRSDIWAFGCVLYEMLTGKRPFAGEDVTDVLVAVLGKEQADWNALPGDTPVVIHALLRRCLEKDRRNRVGDIAAALFAIDGAAATLSPTPSQVSSTNWSSSRPGLLFRFALISLAAVLAAAISGGAVWVYTRPSPAHISRLAIVPPANSTVAPAAAGGAIAITPDGARILYVGNRSTQLFMRPLDQLQSVPLVNSTNGILSNIFISPNGQWVGYFDGPTSLRKVAITGGGPVPVIELSSTNRTGSAWMPDDTIVIGTSTGAGPAGLLQVNAAGGKTSILTRSNREGGEGDHVWPSALPGGHAVLFTIRGGATSDAEQIAVLDLRSGTKKVLLRGGSHAHYVNSGHLVYVAGNTLRAVPFDLDRQEITGSSAIVVDGVVPTVDLDVSADGTLVYWSGDAESAALAPRSVVLVDRAGHEQPLPFPPRMYQQAKFSPDRRWLGFDLRDQERDLWIGNVNRGTLSRLTFGPSNDYYVVWTPDSRRMIFSSSRDRGVLNLFVQSINGGVPERLTESDNLQVANAVSPDGKSVLFHEVRPVTGRDLMLLSLDGTKTVRPLIQTRFEERLGTISPDGDWLAYESNSSGMFEIYVRPFPNVDAGQWQVSNAGGVQAAWGRDGKELFFFASDGALMSARVTTTGSMFSAETPTKILEPSYYTANGTPDRTYDVAPDGQHFLMIKERDRANAGPTPSIVVVQHFDEELKRLVPTK